MSSDYKHFLPDETLIAIGRVTINFAIVERTIAFYIGTLLAPLDQPLGDTVTANMSFKNLISLLSSIHKHRIKDEAEQEKLDTLLKRAITLEGKRNIITHSNWSPTENPEKVMRWKTTAAKGKGLRHQTQEMSDVDLHSIADELTELYADISRFMINSKWVKDNATLTIDLSDRTT